MTFTPNQFREVHEPGEYREGRWRSFEPRAPVPWTLRGREVWLRPGLTFTPYANPTACNAHCSFCSEELLRVDAERLTAKTLIGDFDRYFDGLERAWNELRGFEMGLSLSGLEATSHPEWMLRLLQLVGRHDALFPSRVLYTNGSGLAKDARLLDALVQTSFTGVELSRAHFDEKLNHLVMRFERDEPIREARTFRDTVARILEARLPLKLVCIANAKGVSNLKGVERYVDEARELGVKRVVFRSLSELGSLYADNKTSRWIAKHHSSVRAIAEQVFPTHGALRDGWEFIGVTSGYYYSNELYRRGGVEVVFEAASYVAHDIGVKSGVFQKLVFHSTGELCGDWVPNAQVIGNYFE